MSRADSDSTRDMSPALPTVAGFELEGRLGRGCTGEVFRARQLASGELVALKLSHPSPRRGAEDIAFRLEYHLHARLRHPHILRAHDLGEIDELRRFYTMDLVETVLLAELFRQGGVTALAEVALAVCLALEYAHAQGILHSDIKPENLLVSAQPGGGGRVLLADFGHSRRLGDQPPTSLQGTFAYLAPEEITGWRTDGRADLYSLGVTLFEAITGRLPYPVTTPKQLFQALLDSRSPSIREIAPDLDPEWAALLDSLISRNPEERPDSAAAAADRIAALLGRRRGSGCSRAAAGAHFGPTLAFVGRSREIRRVIRALRESDPVRTILISGERGVGKSRFAEELTRTIELEGGRVYRSDARDESSAGFRLLRRIWKRGECVDLTGVSPHPARKQAATERPEAHEPHQKQARLEALVEALVPHPTAIEDETLYLFDSLECADLDSLEFLQILQRRLAGTKSLLCLVCETLSAQRLRERFRESETMVLALAPFTREEIAEFLLAHLGEAGNHASGSNPPLDGVELEMLVGWMSENTGGNPRLIESALRSLVSASVLEKRPAGWRLRSERLRSEHFPLAPRDRAVEKLHQLPSRVRSCLELACVAGPEFEPSVLAALESGDGETMTAFFAEALKLGILLHGRGGRYRFTDPEAARALRESLEPARRRELHLLLAEHLERAGADEASVEFAWHLEHAGRRREARRAYVRAASANRATGAFHEAAEQFRKAWELHTEAEKRRIPAFAPEWAATLHTNSQFEEAIRVADEILAHARTPDLASSPVVKLLILKALSLRACGHREECRRVLRSVLEGNRRIADPGLEAWALTAFGNCEAERSRGAAARECFLRARKIGIRRELPEVVGRAELHLGILSWREDDPARALEWQARAHDHLVEAEAEELLPAVWGNQAICHWFLLEAHKAASFHRKAADGYVRQHRRSEAARSYQNLAHVLVELGQWAEAERAMAAAERLNRTLRGPRQASYFEYNRASMALYRGNLERAMEHISRALELAQQVGDALVTVGHRCLRGVIELDAGRASEAERTGRETLVAAREINYRFGIAKSLYILGRAARLAGDSDEATLYLEDALRAASKPNQPVVLFRVQLARAELLAEKGVRAEVRRALAVCRRLQEECDSVLWQGLLHLSEGKALGSLGEHERACHALGRAYEVFANLGAERLRAETLAHLAHARLALGSRNAARAAWRHARSIHRNLGLPMPNSPFPEEGEAEDTSLLTVQRILEAAASVSRDITTLQSIDEVLERILDVAITYLGTERGVAALADPETGELQVRCARNIDRESIADGLEISRSTLDHVGQDGEMIHTGDALADPRLSLHESVRRCRIRSLISLPIRWGDEVLGALYMDHRVLTDLFGREERLFLRFIADMAAVGIRNARQFEIKEDEVRNLRGELEDDDLVFSQTVIGRSPRMRELVRQGVRAARDGKVILLAGPSGVGKDHLARILHEASGRNGPFVDCPLPTLPESLIEGELFGVARGAATHVEPRQGLAEVAQHGTLFLNEVADLPASLQPKLLHFLERREFRNVGSTKIRRLEGLIICATNADLEERVREGLFREDLFYRMCECVLEIPRLAERAEDIPGLADLFLREFERKSGRGGCVLHPLALDLLMRCRWEGNIRELKSCLSRAFDESGHGMIEPHHLESPSLRRMRQSAEGGAPGDVRQEVHAVEIRRIHEAMTRSGGIITRAAPLLGLSEAALRRRIRKYHLENLVLIRKPRSRARG